MNEENMNIEEILTLMSENFIRSEHEEHREIVEKFLKTYETIPSGREFERAHLRPEERKTSALIDGFLERYHEGSREELWRARFYYKHYSVIRSQLNALMAKFEGIACSVDKSGILLSAYETLELNERRGSRAPLSENAEKELLNALGNAWITPREEFISLWIDLIDQFIILLHGEPEAYVTSYANLEESYRKLKET